MRVLACVGLALLLGCSGKKAPEGEVDAGPPTYTEQEPNDRAEQALALKDWAIVNAQLAADPSKGDEDWYELAPPAPRSVDVQVSGIPGADVAIEVYDADRNRLVAVNSEGVGKPERLPNLLVKDRALVMVRSAKRGSGGSYTLTVLFGEPAAGFEQEPNDRKVDANALPLGTAVQGRIGHAGDEDWYQFELVPGGAAEVQAQLSQQADASGAQASGDPDAGAAPAPVEAPGRALRIELGALEGVRFEVQVLSEAEAPLFKVTAKENEPLSLRNVGVRATDRIVYVVVKSAWIGTGKEARRGYSSESAYSLSVAQEEAGANAELEPNDEAFKATPLPANGFREGFLSPKSDVDYYVVRGSGPVLADLQLSGVDRVDAVLTVLRPGTEGEPAERVVLKANDGVVKEPEHLNNVLCANECLIKVEGGMRKVENKWVKDFENAEQTYRLSVQTTPATDVEEREPNNTADEATPVQLGKPVRGTVQPKKDTDYYRLDLSSRPVKTALKASVIGILKVDVGLYLHRVDSGGSMALVQTADRAKGEAPEIIRFSADPGVYILEVRDAKGRESNFQDAYQLTVEEGE